MASGPAMGGGMEGPAWGTLLLSKEYAPSPQTCASSHVCVVLIFVGSISWPFPTVSVTGADVALVRVHAAPLGQVTFHCARGEARLIWGFP